MGICKGDYILLQGDDCLSPLGRLLLYAEDSVTKNLQVNPFPNKPFWDCPKFKEAADVNWNMAITGF